MPTDNFNLSASDFSLAIIGQLLLKPANFATEPDPISGNKLKKLTLYFTNLPVL